MDPAPRGPTSGGPPRLALWELGLLVAGLAVGFWLFGMDRSDENRRGVNPFGLVTGLLGGASVVGPPILLWGRRRRRGRWGPGQVLWFSEGAAAWLLWPPVIVARTATRPPRMGPESTGAICFAYGTPLMAIYVGSALLFGGWVRRGRRGRRRRDVAWSERFGLVLSILWAATGLYVLYLVYSDDIK